MQSYQMGAFDKGQISVNNCGDVSYGERNKSKRAVTG